jgi:hypothetical protein
MRRPRLKEGGPDGAAADPVFALRLRPLPRVDGIRALRRGLKHLLRACGLQCLEAKLETPKEKIHAANRKASRRRADKARRAQPHSKAGTSHCPAQAGDASNPG